MSPLNPIRLIDTVPGSVTVEQLSDRVWRVTQRAYGDGTDNNHAATWLRVENDGADAPVQVRVVWAEFRWMALRRFGYVRRNGLYKSIEGRTTPTETVYTFTVPSGVSEFGVVPWYSNEDGDAFLAEMAETSPLCRARSFGETAEGRELRCLTVEARPEDDSRRNVVVCARVHANETPGSWAVEATARFLLGGDAPAEWLRDYRFHLIPIVNPDGVARGIKMTRPGPVALRDVERGGMTSDDPTIKAYREEMLRLRPAALIDHHCYLFRPAFILAYDKRTAVSLLGALLGEGGADGTPWMVHLSPAREEAIRATCHKRFGAVVVATELPWQGGRLPEDVARLGLNVFKAAMGLLE